MKKSNFKFLSGLAFVTLICFFSQYSIADCRNPNDSSKCKSTVKPEYKENKKGSKTKNSAILNKVNNSISVPCCNTSVVKVGLSYTSVYDYLSKPGNEKPGYGLYSYVLFPHSSPRTISFLQEFFKTIGLVNKSLLSAKNLNLIYIPIQAGKPKPSDIKPPNKSSSISSVSISTVNVYDYARARSFLVQICKEPTDIVRSICETDLSGGPYLFTYTNPASSLSLMPPPYLFVDLSNVHERAFGEFIAAYKAQIKRTDYTDMKRIDNLRLRVLNIVLTAADLINPMKDAIADILYMAKGEKDNNSNSNTASTSPVPKNVPVGGHN